MKRPLQIASWLVVFLFVAVRVQLFRFYAATNGFDSYSHIDYLNMAFHGVLPHANQLWQSYHAPGYYIVSAQLAHLTGLAPITAGQVVSVLCSLLVGVVGYFLARRLLPGWEPLVVLGLLAIPGSVNTSAMVYSQQLATFWVGVFCLLLVAAWDDPKPVVWREIALGVVWGVAIMSRLDGFFLGIPLGLMWMRRLTLNRSGWLHSSLALLLSSLLAFSIASPLLFRNIADFNQPFVRNRHQYVYPYPRNGTLGLPGFMNVRCLVNPGLTHLMDPATPNLESLPAALFVSWWGGSHRSAFPGQVAVVLGLLLSCLALWGVAPPPRTWTPLFAVAFGNCLLMGLFLAGEPDWGGYKSLYFHGTYYLFALALALGVRRAVDRWGGKAAALCLGPCAILALNFLLYWRPS